MIIFYNKKSGQIIGTIDGRIHPPEHLKMWVGDKKETDRLVIQWKPVKWYDEKGEEVSKTSKKVFTADFEPDCSQKELVAEIEKNPSKLYNYKVDTNNKTLIKK